MVLKHRESNDVDWTDLTEDRDNWLAVVHTVMNRRLR